MKRESGKIDSLFLRLFLGHNGARRMAWKGYEGDFALWFFVEFCEP